MIGIEIDGFSKSKDCERGLLPAVPLSFQLLHAVPFSFELSAFSFFSYRRLGDYTLNKKSSKRTCSMPWYELPATGSMVTTCFG